MDETRDPAGPLRSQIGRLSLIFLVAVAGGLVAAVVTAGGPDDPADAAAPAPVGEQAPEILLQAFDGTTWTLSEHLATDGRPVVLNLWASWCPPCREEIPAISAFSDAHPEVLVVGAAVDDRPEDARALAEELGPTYLVGMDASGDLRSRYPSFGLPATFVIDPDGIVRSRLDGIVTVERLEDALG